MLNHRAKEWLNKLQKKTGHAYSVEGVQAEECVQEAIKRLLCEKEGDDAPCNHCKGCRMLAAGTHPDYRCISIGEKDTRIKIGTIRLLREECFRAPYYGQRVIWIRDAHLMTEEAQNALLRTLEEPPERTTFLLTGNPQGLLATIQSRCAPVLLGGDNTSASEPDLRSAKQILEIALSSGQAKIAEAYTSYKENWHSLLLEQIRLLREIIALKLEAPLLQGQESDIQWLKKHASKHSVHRMNTVLSLLIEADTRVHYHANSALLADWLSIELTNAIRPS